MERYAVHLRLLEEQVDPCFVRLPVIKPAVSKFKLHVAQSLSRHLVNDPVAFRVRLQVDPGS